MTTDVTTTETRPGQRVAEPEKFRAITAVVDFEKVKHVLEKSPPPRRPNRNRPINGVQATENQAEWTEIEGMGPSYEELRRLVGYFKAQREQ